MGMKINDTNRQQGNITGKINSGSNKVGNRINSFGSQLKRQSSQNSDEMLQNMAKNVVKQGERLTDKVDISELKVYKKMISEFLEEAVSSFARFSKESFLDKRGRHRLFAIVKKVNTKLEELTEEILVREQDHLKIIGKIEDIRGLILDMLI